MVLFALSLAVFLSLAAVAVDASILYSWRLRVERASKAAAFSALQYRSMRGWGYFFNAGPTPPGVAVANFNVGRQAEMTNFLLAAVTANLQTGGNFNPALLNLNGTTYDGTTDTLTLNVSYNAQTFFIGNLLPLISPTAPQNNFPVTYQTTASLDSAAVALLLDVSGSMNCPNGNCACRTTGNCAALGNATIDNLVAALGQFNQFFNPFKDYIAVIPFNLAATTSFPIVNGGAMQTFGGSDGSRLADFNLKTSRAGLNPQSNTNICDGLIQAIKEFQAIDNIEQAAQTRTRKFTVLFTDGAPNAFRGEFFNSTPPVNPLTASNNPPASLQNDWYEYSLEWKATDGTLSRGPGPLVNASVPLFNHVITATNVAPSGANMCGSVISDQLSFPRVLNSAATTGTAPPFPGCLNGGTINFSLPGTTHQAGVLNVPLDADGGPNTALNYARLPYYCAIEAADWLRTNFNSPVFTIGVGPTGANCGDPFQNVDNPVVRKDNFLHRLAADPDIFNNPANPTVIRKQYDFQTGDPQGLDCNCGPGTPYLCGPAIRTAAQYTPIDGSPMTPQMLGEYYGTATGNQLAALFSSVAKSILLRLGS
jgi:Flp pilus assembly protein TadG